MRGFLHKQPWLPPTGYQCPCGDEDRPGWECRECGGVAKLWLTEEQFADLEHHDPLPLDGGLP